MSTNSILESIKSMLGIENEYTHFDSVIMMHINTVLMTLNQLGVGPEKGFTVRNNSETWIDFIGNTKEMEAIKSYTYLNVRLLFDPPSSSFLVSAIERQLNELTWRIEAQASAILNDLIE